MKTLKLQVGKTYRSREGEVVKIVKHDVGSPWPYCGSSGKGYAADGKWASMGSPCDLIEEVTISDANQKQNEMETLKLEVGKTYRSRKGEEVKIVRMGNKGWDYWEGSNGEWYYEGGKWSYVSEEHPEDLIEEVPSEPTCHTFDVPDGVKKITVSQVGNRIVVEMVPEERKEPKPGGVSGSLTPFGESIKLLRDLADLQNGAPLEQYRKEWEETMKQVYDFLNRWEGQ